MYNTVPRSCFECAQFLSPCDYDGVCTLKGVKYHIYWCPTCGEEYSERNEDMRPTSYGYREFDPEFGVAWIYFNRKLTHEEILSACCRNNLIERSAGPGRYFQDRPLWSQSKTRTVITQRCGFDI